MMPLVERSPSTEVDFGEACTAGDSQNLHIYLYNLPDFGALTVRPSPSDALLF
jgi:hypothetical protein